MINKPLPENGLRPAVGLVALLNLAYFGVEFAVALAIGSGSLFADSIDFLEDATVNGLILVPPGGVTPGADGRDGAPRVPFVPPIATAWTAWQKFNLPVPPAPLPLSLAGLGAL